MIEDVENVKRNSSEEIESPSMYICIECLLLKLYILIQKFIEYVNSIFTFNSHMYI